jgi:probable phosphoglycerate mutase
MAGRLVLLRHGATEWSVSGQHTGRTDIPLLQVGEAQAKAAGAYLRDCVRADFDLVLTSPLVRAADTCRLAGFEGAPDADLMEWDYGDYEGITTPDIRRERPDWSLWEHGVPGGERVAEVGRRVDQVIERARSQPGDTLCIAHGHVLRVLAARWLGLPPIAGRLFLLSTGAICVLGWDLDVPAVELWNYVPGPG